MERARKIINKSCYVLMGLFYAAGIQAAWNTDMKFMTWFWCFALAMLAARLSELEGDSIFGLPAEKDQFSKKTV